MQMSFTKGQSLSSLPAKTALKLDKIRGLVDRALEHVQGGQSKVSSPSKHRSEESSECESLGEVLQNLKRGYLVLKHSVRSGEVNHKFVYLSQDGRRLCWKSLQREDEKGVELVTIGRVVREGAEYYFQGAGVKELGRCVVVLSEGKKLQLEMATQMEAEYLRYELERAVKYSKNMRLNYKYCRN